MLMTRTQRQVARRRSTSAKYLESKQYQQQIIPNKKKNIVPEIDFDFEEGCGIIEDNFKGEKR